MHCKTNTHVCMALCVATVVIVTNFILYSQEPPNKTSGTVNDNKVWAKAWKTGTNGIRVDLAVFTDVDGVPWIEVYVGSAVTNSSGHYYCAPPGRKFLKCEIKDSNGKVLPNRGEPLEARMPEFLPVQAMPKATNGSHTFLDRIGFETNLSPVDVLAKVPIRSAYHITNSDTYAIAVCPVLYELETNGQFFKRINLPCVSTNIFLSADK